MKYKYISGKVLEIDPKSGWKDGMLLEEIYPDSSFVSGNNPESMMMKPFIKDRKVYAKYTLKKDSKVALDWYMVDFISCFR